MLIKSLASSLAAAVLVFVTSEAVAQPYGTAVRRNVGSVASIEIPIDATLDGPTQGPDFGVYTVVRAGRPIVSLYLGNAPDFPDHGIEFTKIRNCLALVAIKKAEGMESGDVLVPMRDGIFPSRLHMFYREAASDLAEQARKIIASMRLLEPRTCIMERGEGMH